MTDAIRSATVFAPATVGNVGVGFDLLGHALATVGDRITVRRIDEPEVRMLGSTGVEVPLDPAANTAGAGLLRLRQEKGLPFGFAVSIEKGIPLGSGMGGSAASAAGSIVAASALLAEPLSRAELLRYGMFGEEVASGSLHADNLAPCILGGLVLARPPAESPDVVSIPVPASLRCVLVHPKLRVDTREARRVLPGSVSLHEMVEQSANLAGVIAGCYSGDLALIGRSLADLVVEPHRASLVRGFDAVKRAALEGGALGCSLSGSGPAVFAWCEGDERGHEIRERMVAAFAAADVEARGWVSPVDAPGARVESVG